MAGCEDMKNTVHEHYVLFSHFSSLANLCVSLAGVREDRQLHG